MMSEPGSDGRLVRYYCTAGNGMEPFLIDEVKRKLAAEEVCQIPGKVLFSSSAGISRVSELKAAERLFLLLKQDSPVRLPAHINPAKAASVLQSRVLGDSNQWVTAAVTWSRLQGELADRWTTVTPPNTTSGVTGKREGGGGSEEAKGETVQRGEKRSREAQTLEKKRKRDDEEKECSSDKNAEKWTTSERERKRPCEEDDEEGRRAVMEFSSCRQNGKEGISEPDLFGRESVCVHATPGLDHYVERRGGAGDFSVEHVKPGGGTDKTQLQPSRTKPDPSPPISFRISCKCTGSLCRYFSTQEVSKVIGAGLSRLLGWKVDLKNPQLEVNVNLSDDHCLLGFPLTRLPLANRSYIKTTGLRSTVAWAMASLAQIQPGFCVVDPMCGVGTILIEASQEHKAVRFLGVDIDDGQLQKANENVEFAELGNRMHLLKASSMRLPVPSASVDAVVCDLPFGRKFGTKTNMAANLPLIVSEMERVLRIGGTLVLLLSPQLSCLLKKLVAQKDTGPPSNQETKPQTGTQDRPSPSLPSTKQETEPQSGLQHSLPAPLRCLKHQATHRVSLGAIDGLIHKYVKIDT